MKSKKQLYKDAQRSWLNEDFLSTIKIISIIFIFLFSISSINALTGFEYLGNYTKAYWMVDNNNFVSSVNELYNLTNEGTTNGTGIINSGRVFTAQKNLTFPYSIKSEPYTICMWVNQTATGDILMISDSSTKTVTQLSSATGKLYWYRTRLGVASDCAVAYGNITNTIWTHICVGYNGATLTMYVNNTLVENCSASGSGTSATIDDLRFGRTGASNTFTGVIDEMSWFNKSLTYVENNYLYNNSKPTIYQQYPFNDSSLLPVTTYTITFNSTPDIQTDTFEILLTANASISIGNLSSNDNMTLYYRPTTTLNNNCSVFYQETCMIQNNYLSKLMTKINDSYFNTTLTDNAIFPAYYPYNYATIDNTVHQNETVYKANNIIFNIRNFSTSISNFNILAEIYAINQSTSTNLLIYYCNSSAVSNTSLFVGLPSTNGFCQLVNSITPSSSNLHSHNNSKHQSIPIFITNITKTQQSYLVFDSQAVNIAQGWYVYYITDSGYNNQSFKTCNQVYTCSATNKIYDIHIHPFLSTDYFSAYVVLNDNSTLTTSSSITDYYNLTIYPPSTSNILLGCNANYTYGGNEYYNLTWSQSFDVNNFTLSYSVDLIDDLNEDDILDIVNSTSNLYANNISVDNLVNNFLLFTNHYYSYRMVVSNPYDSSYSFDCGVTFCENNYVRAIEPCINNVKLINYVDSNNCNNKYNFPATNGTYESCTAITYVQKVYTEDIIIIAILMLLIIIGVIIGITVHEAGFGLSALMSAFLLVTFILYHYPMVVIIASVFLIIVFTGMWILVKSFRR